MLTLIAIVLIVMLLLYAVEVVPIDKRLKIALQIVIILVAVIYLAGFAGIR